MAKTNFTVARRFDEDRFHAETLHEDTHQKTVLAYFEPGQFVPVHAPDSTVTIYVRDGAGTVVEGDDEHDVYMHDVVTVPAGDRRGIRAEDGRMEALLVVAPPPGDEAHEPVRRGLAEGVFRPERSAPAEG